MRTNTRVEFGLYDVTPGATAAPPATQRSRFAAYAVTCWWRLSPAR